MVKKHKSNCMICETYPCFNITLSVAKMEQLKQKGNDSKIIEMNKLHCIIFISNITNCLNMYERNINKELDVTWTLDTQIHESMIA